MKTLFSKLDHRGRSSLDAFETAILEIEDALDALGDTSEKFVLRRKLQELEKLSKKAICQSQKKWRKNS